jgi:hypothetical protein
MIENMMLEFQNNIDLKFHEKRKKMDTWFHEKNEQLLTYDRQLDEIERQQELDRQQ